MFCHPSHQVHISVWSLSFPLASRNQATKTFPTNDMLCFYKIHYLVGRHMRKHSKMTWSPFRTWRIKNHMFSILQWIHLRHLKYEKLKSQNCNTIKINLETCPYLCIGKWWVNGSRLFITRSMIKNLLLHKKPLYFLFLHFMDLKVLGFDWIIIL